MKIFLIKTGIVFFSALVFFKLTIGFLYNSFHQKLDEKFSKEQTILIKEKIRAEMKKGIEKDKILDNEDAELIGKFIKKLLSEINQN